MTVTLDLMVAKALGMSGAAIVSVVVSYAPSGIANMVSPLQGLLVGMFLEAGYHLISPARIRPGRATTGDERVIR